MQPLKGSAHLLTKGMAICSLDLGSRAVVLPPPLPFGHIVVGLYVVPPVGNLLLRIPDTEFPLTTLDVYRTMMFIRS